jgi:hypothetical protein
MCPGPVFPYRQIGDVAVLFPDFYFIVMPGRLDVPGQICISTEMLIRLQIVVGAVLFPALCRNMSGQAETHVVEP